MARRRVRVPLLFQQRHNATTRVATKMKFSEQHALELMRTGQCLVRLHTRHRVLWLLANGEVTGETAKKILERPDVEALGDGLFVGLSQTFRWWGA